VGGRFISWPVQAVIIPIRADFTDVPVRIDLLCQLFPVRGNAYGSTNSSHKRTLESVLNEILQHSIHSSYRQDMPLASDTGDAEPNLVSAVTGQSTLASH